MGSAQRSRERIQGAPLKQFHTVVAFDTETWLLEPGNVTPPVVCMSYVVRTVDGDAPPVLVDPAAGAMLLREWLEDPGVLLIGHRVEYDFGVMCAYDPSLIPLVFAAYANDRVGCTLQREKLVANSRGEMQRTAGKGSAQHPGRGYSMAAILYRRFGIDRWADKGPDAWRLRYGTLDGVPLSEWPESASKYALDDARDTLAIWDDQDLDARRMGAMFRAAGGANVAEQTPLPFVQDEPATCRAAWALHLAGAWGLRTDPVAVARARDRYAVEIAARDEQLLPLGMVKPKRGGGYSRDMAAIRARVAAAYAQIGQDPPLTDTGIAKQGAGETDLGKYVSTSGDTLIAVEHVDGALQVLRERQDFEGSRTRYLAKMLEAGLERPITPAWSPLVETGRTACSKPPIQQTPKHHDPIRIRPCFVPRPGFLFGAADYSTAELRALAFVCLTLFGWSKMADALKDGLDLHWQFAAWILGVDPDAVREHPEGKLNRQTAKAANFGFPGGMGAAKFVISARKSYRVQIEGGVEGAKELKRKWLAAWPEVASYFEFIADACSRQGDSFLAVQFGSGRLRGGCGYCDGANTFFQGLVADGAKAALFDVSRECYVDLGTPLFGSRPVAFMHDEIIIESPEDRAPAAADRLSAVMVAAMERYIKGGIPIECEPAIMRRWYPKAETVRDADGVLQPWEPPCTT
jgi:DNA polymerase-1